LATIIQVQKWLNRHFFGVTKQGAKTMDCLLELLQKGWQAWMCPKLNWVCFTLTLIVYKKKFYNVSNHFKMVLGLNSNAIQLLKGL